MPTPKDVHRVFHEFADITSMHGVPRIINARSLPARICWSIICLAAFVMFLWQSAILLQRYYSYPKKVNVEVVQRPVQFPAVSVCNSDPLDLLVVNKLSSSLFSNDYAYDNNTDYANYDYDQPYEQYEQKVDSDYEDILNKITQSYADFYDLASVFFVVYGTLKPMVKLKEDSIIMEISSRLGLTANLGTKLSSLAGVQLRDFIVSCRFMDDTCNITKSFTKIFDPYFFNCFTFRPETILPNRATRLQGVEYGLSLLLFTGSTGPLKMGEGYDDLIIPGMQESDVALASGKGARVVIHSPDTLPHPTQEGFDVPPGFSVEIGVKARENVRIRQPHGNCTDETSENSTFRYTLIQCQHECIQQTIMKVCKCIDNRLPVPPDTRNLPYCFQVPSIPESCMMTPEQQCYDIIDDWTRTLDCRKEVYENMTIRDPEAIESCSCFPPCNDIVYDTLYSLSTLPENFNMGEHSAFYSVIDQFITMGVSPDKIKYFNKTYGPDYATKIGEQISRLNVHIADSNIIKTTEAPDYEAIRLVSDIGGQLGLWIGISVMTLFEVLQLFADVFRYLTASGRHFAKRVPNREPILASSFHYDPHNNLQQYDPPPIHNDPKQYDPNEPYAVDPQYRDHHIPTPRRFNQATIEVDNPDSPLVADVFHFLTTAGRHQAERVPTREPVLHAANNKNGSRNSLQFDPNEPYATDPRYRNNHIPTPRRFHNSTDRIFGVDPETHYEIDKLTTV